MENKLNHKIEFDADAVFETDLFKISSSTLKDERLVDNIFYNKLISRLNNFYIQAEKYRLLGPN
jgi:hypothetical protein